MNISFTLRKVMMRSQFRSIPPLGKTRLNCGQRNRWNNAWRLSAGLAAWAERNGQAIPEKAAVTITIHSIRQIHPDNAHAAVKPILDGLKGIAIVDDSPDHIELDVKQERVAHRDDERVVVEVVDCGNRSDANH